MGNLILSFMHRKICDQVFFFRGGGGGRKCEKDGLLSTCVVTLSRSEKRTSDRRLYSAVVSSSVPHIRF